MTTAAHLHQMQAFIADRRGWYIARPDAGEMYAWRTVKVLDVAFHLFLQRDSDRPLQRDGWMSFYRSDAGTLADIWTGTYDVVTAEVTRVERCLDVINALRDCRTGLAARELVEPLKGDEVRLICRVLGLSRVGQVSDLRDQIVQQLCGAGVGRRAT